MNKWGKIAIGAGLLFGGGYVFRMNRTSTNLEIEINTSILSLKLTGVTVKVDAKIKNPTDGSLKIKYPFFKLIFKGETLGSSQVIDKNINILSFGEAKIEGMLITIPLSGIFSIGMEMLTSLKTKTGVKVTVKVITTIYTVFSSIPYEQEIEQVLKVAKQ